MKKLPISTNEKIIDELLTRSIFQILPSKNALKKELLSGRRLRIYVGADATAPELHIGHSTNFILLEKLRRLGHEVIILFGDFTAMVGDPTGKESARQPLSPAEIKKNLKTWKKQIAPILSFTPTPKHFGVISQSEPGFADKKNPAKILQNSTWLKKLNFEEILKLASFFTVQHMIERDMFEKRMNEGKPIHLHEFLYPLMQGYDSVAMDVDVEIGGSDQIFNMLVGRVLQKKYNNKEKFIIATTLLEDPRTGKKLMSKSEGNFISLLDAPEEMYGKTMALPDEVIVPMFIDGTLLSLAEIEKIKKELAGGKNPRDVKMRLAFELTALHHGKKKAKEAQKKFIQMFQKKQYELIKFELVHAKKGELLQDILVNHGYAASKSQSRRLIEGGGIYDVEAKKQITDPRFSVKKTISLRIGKKRFVKIKVS